MHKYLRYVLALAMIPSTNGFCNADGERPSSLWEIAKVNNAELKQAQWKIIEATSSASATYSNYLPKAVVSSSSARIKTRSDSMNDQFDRDDIAVVASQDLFNKEGWNQRSSALLSLEIAKAQARLVDTRVRLEILRYYWQILRDEETIEILQVALNGPLRTLEEQAKHAVEGGVRTAFDLSSYLNQIDQLKLTLMQLDARHDTNLEGLSVLIGAKSLSDFAHRNPHFEGKKFDLPNRKEKVEFALERLNIENEKLNLDLAGARFYPTLSIEARIGRSRTNLEEPLRKVSYEDNSSLGLSLNFPLFNGFSDFNNRQAAKTRLLAAEARKDSIEYEMNLRIANSEKRMMKAQIRLQEAIRLTQSAYDLKAMVERRQVSGLVSFDQLIGPSIQLVELSMTKVEALYEALTITTNEFAEAGSLDDASFNIFENAVLN